MKTLQKALVALLFLLLLHGWSSAQDIIILKTGERIEAKIIEINDVEIKWREYRDPDGIIFTMSRGKIREIRYETGRREKEYESGPGLDPAYYVDDRRNNIKINFLAVSGSTTILIYERALNPKSSVEASLKINGLGFNDELRKSGMGLDLGYKLKLGSLFKKRNEYRPKHILAGSYFRPVLGFNSVTTERGDYKKYTYAHFGLDLGGQWIISNIVSLDLFAGWHYYGGNFDPRFSGDVVYQEFADGNLFAANNNSAFALGFNVGVLFGKQKIDPKKRRR